MAGFSVTDPAPTYVRLGPGAATRLELPLFDEAATAIKVAVTVATGRTWLSKTVQIWSDELSLDCDAACRDVNEVQIDRQGDLLESER